MFGLINNALNPTLVSVYTQSIFGGKVESEENLEIIDDSIKLHKNVTYSSNYETSQLDIYQVEDPKGTLFYVHGGGYVFDDKS